MTVLSEDQQAVVDGVLDPLNHNVRTFKVLARAGTGKTTTLKYLCEKLLQRRQIVAYTAFNKSTKASFLENFPNRYMPGLRRKTIHGFCWSWYQEQLGEGEEMDEMVEDGNEQGVEADISIATVIDACGLEEIVRRRWRNESIPSENSNNHAEMNRRKKYDIELKWLAKAVLKVLSFYTQSADEAPQNSHNTYTKKNSFLLPKVCAKFHQSGSIPGVAFYGRLNFAGLVSKLYAMSIDAKEGTVPLTFDTYQKECQLKKGKWCDKNNSNIQYLLVDEAQDLNDCQMDMILTQQQLHNCRLIFVGDTDQSINQFRGASSQFGLLDVSNS